MRGDEAPAPDDSRLLLEVVDHLDEDDKRILCGAIVGVDLTEVYSSERIARVCGSFQLLLGSSYDLTNGWNCCLASHRAKAIADKKEQKPTLLVGSPPCTMMSILQTLNQAKHGDDPVCLEAFNKKVEEA